MRILFICGSLEQGKDGVGDYTRRLAGELIRKGHDASIIALHDKFLTEARVEENQCVDGTKVCVLRLSSNIKWKERNTYAKEWVAQQNPEWLSLQYVCFGFQKKGLPFGLAHRLKRLGVGRKWHIMFHELWVGMEVKSSYKMSIWGFLQRKIIIRLIKKLHPLVISTQTLLYKAQLKKLGCDANLLPLFGNIHPNPDFKKKDTLNIGEEILSFVLFGSIHKGAPIRQFAKEIQEVGTRRNVKVEIVFIGRCGNELEPWRRILEEEGIDVRVLGEQAEVRVSEVLSSASYGVATTPYLLIEKSGTAASMVEHGLVVICVARNWVVEQIQELAILPSCNKILHYKEGNLEKLLYTKAAVQEFNTVSEVSKSFISALR